MGVQLSHSELVKRASKMVTSLLDDPFLSVSDLPRDVGVDKVTSLLALELGRAITVYVRRFDEELIREWRGQFSNNLILDGSLPLKCGMPLQLSLLIETDLHVHVATLPPPPNCLLLV